MFQISSQRLVALTVAAAASGALVAGTGADAAASCKAGKETKGCNLKVGGFYEPSDPNFIVAFIDAKGVPVHSTLSFPATVLCGDVGTNVTIQADSTKYAKVGGSVKFTKATVYSGDTKTAATVSFTLKVKSAGKASIKGTASVPIGSATCAGSVPKTSLKRVLGG